MATREELLIIARLQDRATLPLKDIRQEMDRLGREITDTTKASTAQRTELRRLGNEYKRTQRDMRETQRRMEDVGRTLSVRLTLPIVATYGAMALAASNLTEQQTRSNVVFQQNAAAVQAWARGASTSMGLSTRAALETSAGFGNFFNQMGIGIDQSTRMSQTLVQLSADIASFNNVQGGAAVVAETFSAAFRGEYDSLQRYVPAINAAMVEQRAMAMGLADANGELSLQAKAMATYDLLLSGAGAAVGDFARTQDNAANRMRIAQAAIEDAAAELGENLLPLVAKGAEIVAFLAQSFGDLPEPVQNALLAIGGIAAVAGPIVYIGSKIVLLRTEMQAATVAGNTWATSMTANAGRVAAGLAGLTFGIGAGLSINANADAHARGALAGLPVIDETNRAAVVARYNELRATYSRLQRQAGRGRGAGGSLLEIGQNLNPFAANEITDAERATHIYGDELDRLLGILDDIDGAMSGSGGISADFGKFGDAARSAAGDLDALNTAADEFRQRWDSMFGGQLGVDQALRGIQTFVEGAYAAFNDPANPMTSGAAQDLALSFFSQVLPDLLEAEVAAGLIADDQASINARAQDYITRVLGLVPGLNDQFGTYVGLLNEAESSFESQQGLLDGVLNRFVIINTILGTIASFNSLNSAVRSGQPWQTQVELQGGQVVGDSPFPLSAHLSNPALGGSTLAAWRAVDSMLPGSRMVTSHVRDFGLGSSDSDHRSGRAVDVIGSNLAMARAMVRKMGGAAEFHGTGPTRHLHVVPPAAGPRQDRHYDLSVQAGPNLADVERVTRRAIRQADTDARRLAERR